jgi:urease accessory protein
MTTVLSRILIALFALAPTAAFAHTGHGEAGGFVHGFMHPVGGLDHVLAMVTVGLFAYQLGGRSRWLVPASFVGVMAIGGLLGMAGVTLPFVETGIALSVVVLGAIVALRLHAPVAIAMGVVGLFAVFHGYAHGAEMPAGASGASYATGFMIATALLHVSGLAAGALIGRIAATRGRLAYQLSGGAVALAGLALLVGIA